MQDTVDDDTMKLFVVGLSELLGIGSDRVERDDEVAVEDVVFTVVESDDVCVVVMTEVFTVDFQNLLIVTEQIANLANPFTIAGGNGFDPSCGLALFDVGHAHALCLVCNHFRGRKRVPSPCRCRGRSHR